MPIHIIDLFIEMDIMKFENINIYLIGNFLYKFHNNLFPVSLVHISQTVMKFTSILLDHMMNWLSSMLELMTGGFH